MNYNAFNPAKTNGKSIFLFLLKVSEMLPCLSHPMKEALIDGQTWLMFVPGGTSHAGVSHFYKCFNMYLLTGPIMYSTASFFVRLFKAKFTWIYYNNASVDKKDITYYHLCVATRWRCKFVFSLSLSVITKEIIFLMSRDTQCLY